jgi:putative ABC transport system permease protein
LQTSAWLLVSKPVLLPINPPHTADTMESLLQDVRFALRSLWKSRLTTALAIACLALGIGANTAIFSVVRAVLLESLPYRAPEQLVVAYETISRPGVPRAMGSVSPPNYFAWREQSRIFQDLAAFMPTSRDLGDVSDPERLRGIRATANLFDVLGARALIGRTFLPSDVGSSAASVAVISEGLWHRHFAADRNIVGSAITLSGVKVTVIGVMPASFDFPVSPLRNDIWIPLDWSSIGGINNRGNHSLQVVGRLAADVDSAKAMDGLTTLSSRLEAEFPDSQHGRGIQVMGLAGHIVGKVRPALLVLLGAVGIVLLIVCANVANLLLTRAAGRRRELAIRTALGAARSRLVRQLLTESAALGLAGGVLGVLVARWTLVVLHGLTQPILPHAEAIGLRMSVLLFALGVSLATGLVVGIIPALRASQVDLREDLTDAAGRSSAGGSRRRALDVLIVAEVALSLVLLVAAGLVIRSFVALLANDPGFSPERVLTFRVAVPPARVAADTERYVKFYEPVLQRLRSIAGVEGAAFTSLLPIQGGATDRYFSIDGQPMERDLSRVPDAEIRIVSGDYFHEMRIPLVAGREFDDRDIRSAEHVVIVNEELARRYFPGRLPLGRTLTTADEGGRIVGVVRSVRQMGLDQDPRAEFYLPAAQALYNTDAMTFVIRARGRPEDLARAARDVVHGLAPQQPIFQLATMDDVIAHSLTTRRLVLVLLVAFATLALLLSAAGVYGVMAYGVSQRTREIGIRMALGARAGDVLVMVLAGAARVMAVGVGVGLVAAALVARALDSMLYGIGGLDPVTFIAVPVVIGLAGMLAGAVPALRAARVDPASSMRVD